VHAENAILEVVDETGRPVPPGGTGRVLLTTLLNYQTPLIRYDVGDEAVVGGLCACGRGLPTLHRIHGKLRPLLTLPSGRTKSSTGLAERISDVPGHQQYQVQQTSVNSATLRLVPADGWQDSRRAEFIAILHEFFEAPIDVRIELCQRIPPDEGGKTPAFIGLSDDRSEAG
jgi:phenylacetate-CoA ligase